MKILRQPFTRIIPYTQPESGIQVFVLNLRKEKKFLSESVQTVCLPASSKVSLIVHKYGLIETQYEMTPYC